MLLSSPQRLDLLNNKLLSSHKQFVCDISFVYFGVGFTLGVLYSKLLCSYMGCNLSFEFCEVFSCIVIGVLRPVWYPTLCCYYALESVPPLHLPSQVLNLILVVLILLNRFISSWVLFCFVFFFWSLILPHLSFFCTTFMDLAFKNSLYFVFITISISLIIFFSCAL